MYFIKALVWKGFAKLLKQEPEELAVVFNNVEFLRKTVIPEEGKLFWRII